MKHREAELIAVARESYAHDRITLVEFEAAVEDALTGKEPLLDPFVGALVEAFAVPIRGQR